MTSTQKEYFISSLITFGTGFIMALIPVIDSLTVDSFQNGAMFGILLAALRAGIKALAEMWLMPKAKVSKKK